MRTNEASLKSELRRVPRDPLEWACLIILRRFRGLLLLRVTKSLLMFFHCLCADIENGEMTDFQIRGLNWLISFFDQRSNGILADKMVTIFRNSLFHCMI